jgi:pilus assembly protein CpaC
MKKVKLLNRSLGTAIAVALATAIVTAAPSAVQSATTSPKPSNDITVAAGTGRMVHTDGAMTDLFVADQGIADVQVRSANQLYIFGKAAGETTIYATNKAGRIVYSANVHVGTNYDSIGRLLSTAMPEAQIRATPMNGVVLLTGTVKAPEDVEEAGRIVQAYVGDNTKIITRLKTAMPLQVMLRVRFAEVSRSLAKDIGVNLLTRDTTSGFLFGLFRGAPGSISDVARPVFDSNGLPVLDPSTGTQLTQQGTQFGFLNDPSKTVIGMAGHALGLDILSAIELAETDGRATILAEPTLTALSGETASFLAGGEFPIPISQQLGSISVEYKQYGVGLAFTPTVLDDGRISMRVRPEVSELTDQGSIRLNNFQVPALTTRRAETTVELGSGQSFMIGGLLRNTSNNAVDKAPWLGDLPILGMLFRSNSFRRQETELVIIVTPYLVKPVSDSQIALPTDGYRTPNDAQRIFLDRGTDSESGEQRPGPTLAPAGAAAPAVGPGAENTVPAPNKAHGGDDREQATRTASSDSAKPGFSFQ